MSGGDLVPRSDADPTTLDLVSELQDLGLLDDVSLRPGELDGGLTVGQVLGLGGLFGRFARSVPWWIGDLLVYCRRWGEDVVGQVEAVTGLHPETLADYERMAETIAAADRVPGLSFRHHRAIKTLDSGERHAWLRRSVEQGWSSDRLRVEIQAERAQDSLADPPSQLQVARSSLREVAAEIVAMSRDEHGRVVLDRNVLERLRAALGGEAAE